jgi:DNA-binding CsgD family transcriptional regulator
MQLSSRDLDTLQGAILDVHEERDIEGLREAAPRIFTGAIPCDHFIWMEIGFAGGEEPLRNIVHWESPPLSKPQHLRRLIELMDEHPFTTHAAKTGDWGPLRLSDFWSTRQLLASALYRDVYRHAGVGRLMSCAAFRGNRMGSIGLSRPFKRRDFSDRDLLVFKLLMPHFLQALRAAEQATARLGTTSQSLPTIGLTKREFEVAGWVARGRTNPEIATILAMSQRTVEKHVERILIKLGVENRTAAARLIAGTVSLREQAMPAPGTPRMKHWMPPKPSGRKAR